MLIDPKFDASRELQRLYTEREKQYKTLKSLESKQEEVEGVLDKLSERIEELEETLFKEEWNT